MLLQIRTTTEEETTAAGRAFGATLTRGAVVALYGDLGAGKTAFTRGIAAALGYAGRVTSPTFAIVNEYDTEPPLMHFDAYRLGSAEELYDIGWDDYLERRGICVVEWAENIETALPEGTVRVRIEKTDNGRVITIG